ncbi:SDR family NAD(P)-dependent oxidoreductase [Arthrobacter sp. B1805]|uniref:SDR family NAD(P)-dependent oxidoreductase n=1 Tax=Arthrobacter sp. B1805 TaxID=2058892 RepID=UPI000CE446BE|nr:SDR family NAD(P)-dependent oxidoreductase [Arthrobacter sp. B1805]
METSHRTIVVTGATSGIGKTAAQFLASRNVHLIVQGPERAEDARSLVIDLEARGARAVTYISSDFSSLDDVSSAAQSILETAGSIDVLVNNAGIPGADRRRMTPDGHERTLQVNYLAMVLLTELLLPALHPSGKIINLSSTTHRTTHLHMNDLNLSAGYSPVTAYAHSKLAILTYSLWLARELEDTGINVVSISPGVISTSLLHSMFGSGGATLAHGAQRVIEAIDGTYPSGTYIDDGVPVTPSTEARDPNSQNALMAATRDLLAGHAKPTPHR